jgi:ubiquinone/menaquinone biosynthesis C-methylase UbiE
MTTIAHKSAKPSHYDKEAKHYDVFNENGSKIINKTIEEILRKYKVTTVLDLACGTGSQVFWLSNKGFKVTGVDINEKMLDIAKSKSRAEKTKPTFIKGDMRKTHVGEFDAVLTIFNAIGHLTKEDFNKALRNIHNNLNKNGLYIFDIFNLSYLLKDDNITKLTIDWLKKSGGITAREIQYSTINHDGILASFDIYHEQKGKAKPKITTAHQTLQVYSATQLTQMLKKSGFRVISKSEIDGSKFNEHKSERLLIVAQKK